MSPTQASLHLDFPRLVGAKNYPVWKTRVEASLDGKGLRGFIKDPEYQGDSDPDDSDAGSDDEDLNPAHFSPAEAPTQAELDNAVDGIDDAIDSVDVDMEDEDQDDESSSRDDDASSTLSEIPMPASLLKPAAKKAKKKSKYPISLQITDSKGTMRTIDIYDVLFAPELRFNLLSVAKAVKEDFKLTFERTQCNIFHAHRYKVIAKLDPTSGLYQFAAKPASHHAVAAMAHLGNVQAW